MEAQIYDHVLYSEAKGPLAVCPCYLCTFSGSFMLFDGDVDHSDINKMCNGKLKNTFVMLYCIVKYQRCREQHLTYNKTVVV